jgi:ketosteroid isomerase-like protein
VSDAETRYLLDRAEVHDFPTRYANAVDRKDWDAVKALFEEKIELDLDMFGEPRLVWASDYADFCADTLSVFGATQHVSTNHLVEVDGDEAVCTAYLNATHAFTEGLAATDHHQVRGQYTFRLRRGDGGWKAYGLRMAVWFTIGDTSVLARTAAGVPGAIDPD